MTSKTARMDQSHNPVEVGPKTAHYGPVDRRTGLSLREFKREYYRRKPVILTGGPYSWKAWSSWTWEHFKNRCGRSPITVYPYQDNQYRQDGAQKLPLAQYIDNILVNDFDTYPYYMIYNS